jgi:hypothetical protein
LVFEIEPGQGSEIVRIVFDEITLPLRAGLTVSDTLLNNSQEIFNIAPGNPERL